MGDLLDMREEAAVSARLVGLVWDGSTHKGSELLVLLAIADNANGEKDEAYPSVGYLAEKTRLSRRNVQYVLKALYASGELEVVKEGGWGNRANVYRLNAKMLRSQARERRRAQSLRGVLRVAQ